MPSANQSPTKKEYLETDLSDNISEDDNNNKDPDFLLSQFHQSQQKGLSLKLHQSRLQNHQTMSISIIKQKNKDSHKQKALKMIVAVIRMLKIVTMRLIHRKDSIYWKKRLGRTSKLLPWSWTIFSNVLSRDTTRKWKTSMAPIGSKTKRSNFRGIYENFWITKQCDKGSL